jgi:hypothetical protein
MKSFQIAPTGLEYDHCSFLRIWEDQSLGRPVTGEVGVTRLKSLGAQDASNMSVMLYSRLNAMLTATKSAHIAATA